MKKLIYAISLACCMGINALGSNADIPTGTKTAHLNDTVWGLSAWRVSPLHACWIQMVFGD